MSKMMRTVLLVIVAGACLLGSPSLCRGEEAQPAGHSHGKETCRICGMYIEHFIRTASYVEFNDEHSESYCGVSCAIRAINEKGGYESVKSAQVTGWSTQQRVAMKEAAYVIGSKLVPDMLPNIIAFESKEAAQEFIAKNGGKIEPIDSLFLTTSYRGLTAPFRIPPAAVPSKGVLNVGLTYNSREMNRLLQGAGGITQAEGLKVRPSVPNKMTTQMTVLGIGYGFTDDYFCQLTIPEVSKNLQGTMKNGTRIETSNSGIGDISLVNRWRFWHDTNYDKHLGLLATVTLPTGSYRTDLRDKATMQLGTGAMTFTPGFLYSQHSGQFWIHAAGMYTFNQKNSDDYTFGDYFKAGLAIHWLPNTSDLLGFEYDTENTLPNKYKGVDVANTGRTASYYTLVYQRKIFLCWGGNMNVNLLYGIPATEKVNGIQLGEANHMGIGLQWQRKY